MKTYKIYTDGSYKPSTNQGGYASIILQNDKLYKVLSKGFINTTNNRMELLGFLSALEYFDEPTKLEIYSDSSYVVNSIKYGHYKNWLSQRDESKKNLDIWDKISDWLSFHEVSVFWVKGHNDNLYNELADLHANIAAIVLNPFIDLSDGIEKN